MKQSLTASELRKLLSYDPASGYFTWKVQLSLRGPKGRKAGSITKNGYVGIGIRGHDYYAHRLAWLFAYGEWPKHQIDHINRIRTDNRLLNLRQASPAQNGANHSLRRDNTSGHTGIHYDKRRRKWMATVASKSLGRFLSKEEAIKARNKAAKLQFGDRHPDR